MDITREIFGYIGSAGVLACWIPQTRETLRMGTCGANLGFLILSTISASSLMIYAFMIGEPKFAFLNAAATVGSSINLYFKIFPRRAKK